MGNIHCYIWGANFSEVRQTAPRGSAFKQVTYEVSLYLFRADDPSSPTISTDFPNAIDTVLQALRTAEMPIFIQDPVTGDQSQLLAIGEQMTVDFDVERTLEDQRLVRLLALITATVVEATVG